MEILKFIFLILMLALGFTSTLLDRHEAAAIFLVGAGIVMLLNEIVSKL